MSFLKTLSEAKEQAPSGIVGWRNLWIHPNGRTELGYGIWPTKAIAEKKAAGWMRLYDDGSEYLGAFEVSA